MNFDDNFTTAHSKITRRTLLWGTIASSVMIGQAALALSTDSAQQFLMKAIKDLEAIVNKGSSGAGLRKDVTSFFRKYADVGYIGRAVLGAPWRGLTPEQQEAYSLAFEGYVVRKYSARLGELKGGKGQIVKASDQAGGGVSVDVNFIWEGYEPSKLNFLIADVGGKPKVLDLKIKGLSLLGTERVSVRTALVHRDNDVAKLTEYLNSK